MKQYVWNRTGTKQIINSGWKEFDRQTDFIGTGNVESHTQYSLCVRPFGETECNGYEFPEGHLMSVDLEPFQPFRIPGRILKILEDKNRRESYILYMFFTTDKWKRIEPFCWAVTDYDYKLIDRYVIYGYRQNYRKRFDAAEEALNYITY